MIPFIEAALSARVIHKSPDGIVRHATIEVADATFEIDEASGESQPNPPYLHTDALYGRAVAAGAQGEKPPYTAPYGDRAATHHRPLRQHLVPGRVPRHHTTIARLPRGQALSVSQFAENALLSSQYFVHS
jgi:hypothetical protein